tara:strand:+ start:274 stop:423 length:150 start_codon:yes stop_codon:yes gene_type:complete
MLLPFAISVISSCPDRTVEELRIKVDQFGFVKQALFIGLMKTKRLAYCL